MSTKKYKCHKCDRTFSKQGYLDNHLNQAYACDKPIICKICGDEFKSVQGLNRHRGRKTSCKKIKTNESNAAPVIKENNPDNKCYICGRTYTTKSNLNRHRKSCTIQERGPDLLQLFVNQQKQMENQQRQIELLTQQLTIQNPQTVINGDVTVNNVQQNMYVNVTICSFGKEDLSRLDTNKVMKLLQGQIKDFMPRMIEHVHANPDYPEFHNVFYDPERGKAIVFAPISETEMSWQMRAIEDVSATITDKIREHIRPGNGPYFDTAMQSKDTETANNIIRIAQEVNWKTPEVLDQNKGVLTQVAKNKDFMELVRVVE
jgi:hypothetical protein